MSRMATSIGRKLFALTALGVLALVSRGIRRPLDDTARARATNGVEESPRTVGGLTRISSGVRTLVSRFQR